MTDVSREITIYANQSLTLSCQPRDSPKNLVYWHWISRSDKVKENLVKKGPTFTIRNTAINDTGFYFCSAAEWGIWGISYHIFVNVIGKLLRSF